MTACVPALRSKFELSLFCCVGFRARNSYFVCVQQNAVWLLVSRWVLQKLPMINDVTPYLVKLTMQIFFNLPCRRCPGLWGSFFVASIVHENTIILCRVSCDYFRGIGGGCFRGVEIIDAASGLN